MNFCCLILKLEGFWVRCCVLDFGNEGCLWVWVYLLRFEDVWLCVWLGFCCCEGYFGVVWWGLFGLELVVIWWLGFDGIKEMWNSISVYGFF